MLARRAGLAAAIASVCAGVGLVVGCSTSVSGSAEANKADADAYATEASSSSAAATSSKKAAAAENAAESNCGQFKNRTESAIDLFNAFVDAVNKRAPDANQKQSASSAELRKSADAVAGGVRSSRGDLATQLADRFNEYVAATGALADEADRLGATVEPINRAKDRFNASLDGVRQACSTR